MTNPDPTKFRTGDEVLVRGVLVDNTPNWDGRWTVNFGDESSNWSAVNLSHIVQHTPAPRPIEVGDQVLAGRKSDRWGDVSWTVLAICGDYAWIRHGDDTYSTALLSVLKLFDHPHPEEKTR